MSAPFFPEGDLGLLAALLLGVCFGFLLERGGLGNPHKLTGIFYLRDFAVPRVMFTAIVVASVGLYLLSDLELLDIGQVSIVPTFFWPQIVGGLIFGAGFVVSGYCPGTAVAGLASGRLDALVTLFGVSLGSFLFAVVFPAIEPFYLSSAMGSVTLPEILHVNHWVVIAGVLAMAAGMFYGMFLLEKRLKNK